MLCADEYPDLDINKVIKMCLVHDFGETLTGDIAAFYKTEAHEEKEEKALETVLQQLPDNYRKELSILFNEMEEMNSPEAKLYKSLDNLEAVISHNEASISTWIPLEFEENLTYGEANCKWSEWTKQLREVLKQDTLDKINNEQ